jgi:hypothetical protein
MDRSISGSSMNRNTDVGPVHGSGSPTTRQNSNEGSHGGKCPLDAIVVRSFYIGPTLGGSSRPLTSHGPDVDLQHFHRKACKVICKNKGWEQHTDRFP